MRANSDPRIIYHAKANRAFLVVLNSLQKEALEARLLLWCDLYPTIIFIVIHVAQLVDIVAWNETRMEDQLAHTGKHAQGIG
jgi:predicted short-subunit dehydrogenase-like oxidoreductase (DUF2520 family)